MVTTTTAATYASGSSKSISRRGAGVVCIHHPTKPVAIATGANIAADTTRLGKIAGGKVEDRFQQ